MHSYTSQSERGALHNAGLNKISGYDGHDGNKRYEGYYGTNGYDSHDGTKGYDNYDGT